MANGNGNEEWIKGRGAARWLVLIVIASLLLGE